MFIQLLLIAATVISTHFLTCRYISRKHHQQQYVPETKKQLINRTQLRQIKTHLFLAKLFIAYLIACIYLLVSRFF